MDYLKEHQDLFKSIMDMLENHFGEDLEIVLHDNAKSYEETIVDIRNGHVTGRKVGDGGGKWGMEVLSHEEKVSHRYNTMMETHDGRIIKNSSIFIKNETGNIVGSLCLNLDCTKYLKIHENISILTCIQDTKNETKELFSNDVNEILGCLIEECKIAYPKPSSGLTKEEKIEIVQFLDNKGAFLITKSGDRVCDYLDISKFTLYSYLELIRKNEKGEK